MKEAAEEIGFPCVVKPLMSSSGKGQSLVKSAEELEQAWHYGCEGSRGDIKELIIEEFIKFDSEITLLTVTQKMVLHCSVLLSVMCKRAVIIAKASNPLILLLSIWKKHSAWLLKLLKH